MSEDQQRIQEGREGRKERKKKEEGKKKKRERQKIEREKKKRVEEKRIVERGQFEVTNNTPVGNISRKHLTEL